jgi:hypothetical protein
MNLSRSEVFPLELAPISTILNKLFGSTELLRFDFLDAGFVEDNMLLLSESLSEMAGFFSHRCLRLFNCFSEWTNLHLQKLE